jgi:S1-C subfamily serine protease
MAAPALTAEAIFASARDWTVEIEGDVVAPFAEDSSGPGTGTGFLVDAARGWVLTNAHVAGHSPAELSVTFADGQKFDAQAVYVDPHVDMAVLAVSPKAVGTRHAAPLYCGASPGAGHPVGVLGHPIGFHYTASRGIISGATSRFGQDMLPMDVAVNHGNSGGPVLSLETGQVVGIATATMNDAEVHGITLAVPTRSPCHILDLLRAGQDPSPPDPRLAFAIDHEDTRTRIVVRNGLPQGNIDLQAGDEVLAVGTPAGTRAVTTYTDMVDALRGLGPQVTLKVRRADKERLLTGLLPRAQKITERQGFRLAGATFAKGNANYGPWWVAPNSITVQDVGSGSVAELAGLQLHDVLFTVDGLAIQELPAFAAAVARAGKEERGLWLVVLRLYDDTAEGEATFRRLEVPVEDAAAVGPLPPVVASKQ